MKFTFERTLNDVLNDDDAKKILVNHLGGLVDDPIVEMVRSRTLKEVVMMAGSLIPEDIIKLIEKELNDL
ncbi:MAG: hypothetical protein CVU84_14585 [Firmicutes bacterium HGW-Firmicutes-1]|nr:MAG: hypothetical protein CVU84_14585 [Firmicutes bacterium HGW-Firmicutes-1]